MIEKNSLTGIRDLDREIVNKLSDKDFLQMCSLNRTYSQRVCDDSYFRLRTEKGFPETVPYKDYTETTNKKMRTWKNHYLNIIKYIDLLKSDYGYIYRAEDKSPELLYLAKRLVHKDYSYNKNRAVRFASRNGQLPIVKYLVENGADITEHSNSAIIWASENAHLPVVKYLVEHGADITTLDNLALTLAIQNGHFAIAAYLESLK